MKQELSAAIIGLGVGKQHIKGYQQHPNSRVLSVCDLSKKKLSNIAKEYPDFEITTNADDIFNNPGIDIVSIASYDNYHYDHIIKAIKKNKHVFVEKPLCLYEHEAKHIYTLLLENKNIKLSSNLILRKSPRFLYLRELIHSQELGEIFYIEGDYNYGRLEKIVNGWRGKIEFYSVVYGGGVHIIDLIHWLTSEKIVEVTAYGNNIASQKTSFKFNDMVVCIFKFSNGMIGKMSVNFGCVYPHFHALSVYGTKATFQNTKDFGLLFTSTNSDATPKTIYAPYPGTHKSDLIYSFIESILANDPTKMEVTPKDVFDTMAVCFAIEKATISDTCVSVDYFEETFS